jgi:enamine deaminase RidA (YjgF/YER057c/UK114 family)
MENIIPRMDIAQKLADLGWTLPAAPKPVAAYIPAVRTGDLLFISGQLPMRDGKLTATGKVPTAISIEQAQKAAAQCAVNALAIAFSELGDWNKLARVIRIGVFVQSEPDFTDHPKVANGASELLQQVLGNEGRHARAAIGTNSLPLDAAVEVEFLFQTR